MLSACECHREDRGNKDKKKEQWAPELKIKKTLLCSVLLLMNDSLQPFMADAS